jgi:hypothetical protein
MRVLSLPLTITGSVGVCGLCTRCDNTEHPAFAARWQPENTTPGRSHEQGAGGTMVLMSRMKSLSFKEKFSNEMKPVAAAELMLSSKELEYRRRSR